jgi:enoyl-[acyl-carrier protein] reductase III
VNDNASLDDTRKRCVQELGTLMSGPPGTLKVILHSLAFGSLKPLVGAEEVVTRHQLELTSDVMGHSLTYWVQECLLAGLPDRGARVFAMTSIGGQRAVPNYGPVGAAKAMLEAHIRQLAVELAPAGITANAILAGVTDTAALRQIPGHEKILEMAKQRNPSRRLTQPEDVARCIAALCHPATYWMTGNTLNVDGGENVVG